MSITALETNLNRFYLENKPRIHDPILGRVESVALSPNFKHTGVLLLSCANPSEKLLRFLPTALHAEVLGKLNEEDSVSQTAQSIINALIENPQQFKINSFNAGPIDSDPTKKHYHYFLSTLSDGTYEATDRNTPGKILDYFDDHIYIRGDEQEQAEQGLQKFENSLVLAVNEIEKGFEETDDLENIRGFHQLDKVLSHFSRHSLVEACLNGPGVSKQYREEAFKELSNLATAFKKERDRILEFLRLHTREEIIEVPGTFPPRPPFNKSTDHPHYYWIKEANPQD